MWASYVFVFALVLALTESYGYRGYRGWHYRDSRGSDSHHHDSHGSDSHHDSRGSDSHHDSRGSDSHHDDSRRHKNHHATVHGELHNHFYGGSGDSRHGAGGGHGSYRFNLGGGGDFGPYNYVDPTTGEHKGFERDLLAAVCQSSGQKCYWLLDRYTNCWEEEDGEGYPGKGLLGDYYDACLGYLPTVQRTNSLNFSAPFTSNMAVGLYYKGGPIRGNPVDLTARKVGFVSGWFTNPICLERANGFHGNKEGDYEAVFFDTSHKLVAGLLAGDIEAAWSFRAEYDPQSGDVQAVGPDVYCTSSGLSVMARYSNQGLLDWWNREFEKLQRSGDFAALCRKGRQDHGHRGELYCLD